MKPADSQTVSAVSVAGIDPDVLRAVRIFVRETWPGEPIGPDEETWLAAHGVPAKVPRILRSGPHGAGDSLDRRMRSALAACRLSHRLDVRRLAWRGWLRADGAAARAESSWSLRLAPLIPEPLEMAALVRLRSVMDGLSDLWPRGGRPVLALWDPPPWVAPGGLMPPERLRSFCQGVLAGHAAERKWTGPPEVLFDRS